MTGYILPRLLQTTPELNDIHVQVFFKSARLGNNLMCTVCLACYEGARAPAFPLPPAFSLRPIYSKGSNVRYLLASQSANNPFSSPDIVSHPHALSSPRLIRTNAALSQPWGHPAPLASRSLIPYDHASLQRPGWAKQVHAQYTRLFSLISSHGS